MSLLDALVLATREVRRRPVRALLTGLAVALAAALLTALLAVAGTAKDRVLSQLSHGGSLAGITVEPAAANPAQAGLDDPSPGPPLPLTAAALTRISQLPGVSSVLPVVAADAEVLPPLAPPAGGAAGSPPVIQTAVVGGPLASPGALPVTLLSGRLPAAGSTYEVDATEQYLAAVGLTVSRAAEVVGTRLRIVDEVAGGGPAGADRVVTAEVVGVVDEQLAPADLLAPDALVDAVYASAAGSGRPPTVSAVVVARDLSSVPDVRAGIAAVGYTSVAPVGLIVSVGRYVHVVELVLSGIGIVALLIAALGIANALFAAVRERRREIGVLKAIGARDRDVLRVFLFEAGALGVLGGIAGTILGVVMAAAIAADANAYLASQGLAGVALSIPWVVPVGAVVGSAVVALAAGALPARRAARLPAREAVDA